MDSFSQNFGLEYRFDVNLGLGNVGGHEFCNIDSARYNLSFPEDTGVSDDVGMGEGMGIGDEVRGVYSTELCLNNGDGDSSEQSAIFGTSVVKGPGFCFCGDFSLVYGFNFNFSDPLELNDLRGNNSGLNVGVGCEDGGRDNLLDHLCSDHGNVYIVDLCFGDSVGDIAGGTG